MEAHQEGRPEERSASQPPTGQQQIQLGRTNRSNYRTIASSRLAQIDGQLLQGASPRILRSSAAVPTGLPLGRRLLQESAPWAEESSISAFTCSCDCS